MNKKILYFFGFLVCGFLGSAIVIALSELTRFSHINLIPFGGSSWAVWVYPLAISISFCLSSILFKVHKPIFVFAITLVVSAIIIYLLLNGLLFANPMPFGINAKPF